MSIFQPETAQELAETLAENARAQRTIRLGGAFTKNLMGGPVAPADVTLSTAKLQQVHQYEPKDLTISVGAGLPFADLTRLLEANGQMVPLDPPCFDKATVGGVIVSNSSGPRRRLYGTARDLVIGLTFATLEGKLVQSGGMVVKNVAGLDMGKLMIGSFGTLAAVTTVNFKLQPSPPFRRTFILQYEASADLVKARNALLTGVLQPAAMDAVNPLAAKRIGLEGYCLLLDTGGNRAVMERYTRELSSALSLEGTEAGALWSSIREFTPSYLRDNPDGAVTRTPATLSQLGAIFDAHSAVPLLARAGNGVCYAYYANARAALVQNKSVIEWSGGPAPEPRWPEPGNDFAIMEKIKLMFDPNRLLNRGRLYGRI